MDSLEAYEAQSGDDSLLELWRTHAYMLRVGPDAAGYPILKAQQEILIAKIKGEPLPLRATLYKATDAILDAIAYNS